MSEQQRMRTFIWDAPMTSARAALTMSDREFLEAMFRGELPPPPIMSTLGIRGEEVGEGRVVFAVEPAEYHYNPISLVTVHDSLACTLCDSAMACAIQTLQPAGVGYTSLEVKVNFVRPVSAATRTIRCEGTVIHSGRWATMAEAWIIDAKGKLYAHATMTCLIFELEQREQGIELLLARHCRETKSTEEQRDTRKGAHYEHQTRA